MGKEEWLSRTETTKVTAVEIYVDGACAPNPGKGGWAFVVYRDMAEIHHETGKAGMTTNNAMELMATLKAMRWLVVNEIEEATIFTDSQYVQKCFEARAKREKYGMETVPNADLITEIYEGMDYVNVTVEWIRSHSGNEGNERANELAVRARDS